MGSQGFQESIATDRIVCNYFSATNSCWF